MKAITRFLKTALVLIVIAIGGAIAYAYSGFYDISVGTGHNPVTQWFLETLRDNSIERGAASIEVPPLDDPEMIRAGAQAYDGGCAGCHGHPGRDPSNSWDPAPPPLTRGRPDPARTFWVARNGIKMSAMPRIGTERMDDQALWQVIAFLQTASSLTDGEYRELVEPPPEPEAAEDEAAEDEAAEDDAPGAEESEAEETETGVDGSSDESGVADDGQPESEEDAEDPPSDAENKDSNG